MHSSIHFVFFFNNQSGCSNAFKEFIRLPEIIYQKPFNDLFPSFRLQKPFEREREKKSRQGQRDGAAATDRRPAGEKGGEGKEDRGNEGMRSVGVGLKDDGWFCRFGGDQWRAVGGSHGCRACFLILFPYFLPNSLTFYQIERERERERES